MLTNEQLIQNLEASKAELVHQIVETLMERGVAQYVGFSVAENEQRITPLVEMVLNYFRTADSAILKTSIDTRVSGAVKRGVKLNEMHKAIDIIIEVLKQTIENFTAGDPTNEPIRAKFINRLDMLKTLGNVNAVKNTLNES